MHFLLSGLKFEGLSIPIQVFFFKDFTPCSTTQSSLDALTSIKWKDYGLTLKSIADQDDIALLEWENLPPNVNIDIVLHSYHEEYPLWFAKYLIIFTTNRY